MMHNLQITVNPKIYLKDPESSDLGKRMVGEGIQLIADIGFDRFTFKKLGDRIGSNESSIYRYFENKHMYLVYLTSWYWGWLEYRLGLFTNSISDPAEKLEKAIEVITMPVETDAAFEHIDEITLNKIMINEGAKPFLTAEVDRENQEGYFEIYKRLVARLAEMILGVEPKYEYSKSLSSTVLEGSLHQYFLGSHFPSLTDCDRQDAHTRYFKQLVFASIHSYGK